LPVLTPTRTPVRVSLPGSCCDDQNVRVVAVVAHEPFLFAASIHENMEIFLVHGELCHFRHSIVTECYIQFTVQSFGGILWGHQLSVVFYKDRDLSMLHNQFSLKHPHPLKRLTSSSVNPKPRTSSLGHVRGSSANACAMLCDHFASTPDMRTMPVQLRHTRPQNRESRLWYYSVTSRLLEDRPAYIWPLSRT
jgi:hypothetical protein